MDDLLVSNVLTLDLVISEQTLSSIGALVCTSRLGLPLVQTWGVGSEGWGGGQGEQGVEDGVVSEHTRGRSSTIGIRSIVVGGDVWNE